MTESTAKYWYFTPEDVFDFFASNKQAAYLSISGILGLMDQQNLNPSDNYDKRLQLSPENILKLFELYEFYGSKSHFEAGLKLPANDRKKERLEKELSSLMSSFEKAYPGITLI